MRLGGPFEEIGLGGHSCCFELTPDENATNRMAVFTDHFQAPIGFRLELPIEVPEDLSRIADREFPGSIGVCQFLTDLVGVGQLGPVSDMKVKARHGALPDAQAGARRVSQPPGAWGIGRGR